MLEPKYFKDYKHNYMILQCGREEAARSYQYKILTSDKIKEILRCSVRHINGVTYYYYDISSRTTLVSLYQSAKMSYEQVRDLLWQFHGICDKLAGFFMEESGLVLLPEHIYYDLSSRKYIGLYYPDYQADANAYEPLLNFLLEHIDTEDRQLTESMYRICELAGEAHFLLEDALRILEEGEESSREDISEKMEAFRDINRYTVGSIEMPGNERQGTQRPDAQQPDVQQISFYTDDNIQMDSSNARGEPRKRGHSILYGIFAGVSVLGIAGAAAVYTMYELAEEEEIALYGIIAVLAVCFLLSLWGIFRKKGVGKSAGNEKKETENNIFEEAYAGVSSSENAMPKDKFNRKTGERDEIAWSGAAGKMSEGVVSLENIISKDMGFAAAVSQETYGRMNAPHTVASSQRQETDYYGNTIFFDESKAAEHKLYALDRGNKRHIELKKFPCTIGKMAGCVDYVLADNSVSRIHAKFEQEGDKILMTDMNSTNGTYKNGLRMQPQETVEIEPGDEIRFGSLNYCYR